MPITYRKILHTYRTYHYQAITWLNKKGYMITGNIKISPLGNNKVLVTTDDIYHCKDWPERHDGTKTIDILASTREEISLHQAKCLKATVVANYFRINGENAIPSECFHFDYEISPRTQHPICHFQISNKLIQTYPESFEYKITNSSILKNRCQTIRIPTAFINLPGLFTVIAADHLKENHWKEFMAACQSWHNKIPGFPDISNYPKIANLYAWHWYYFK